MHQKVPFVPPSAQPGPTRLTTMKNAERFYLFHSKSATAVWLALYSPGLLPDSPHAHWTQHVTSIWIVGIPITATRHLFFKDLPGFGPPPAPKHRPNHSRAQTLLMLAIFTAVMP